MKKIKTSQLLVKNIPAQLLEEFDRKARGRYATRSEAIRQLMRDFVNGKIGNGVKPVIPVLEARPK